MVVLNQRSFEGLFRQIGLVEQHVATWITGITRHLPMTEDSIRQLREVALRDSRTWRRLRDIERRGHLAHVSLAEVQRYASRVGLDPAKVVVDGRLDSTRPIGSGSSICSTRTSTPVRSPENRSSPSARPPWAIDRVARRTASMARQAKAGMTSRPNSPIMAASCS